MPPQLSLISTPEWTRAGWTLVWQDEFDGSEIDRTKWVFAIGGHGWGNNELEYYTDRPENARIENGQLVIEARAEDFGERAYTSARLKTQGLHTWQYGRFEARLRLPRGQGLWPAFWLLGENVAQVGWPECGEIDIMENIGKLPDVVHGTLHGPGYSGGQGVTGQYTWPGGPLADDFHVYALEWEPGQMRWYLNETLYQTLTPADVPGRWAYDQPFFLVLNVAVGGYWPGYPDATTAFPQRLIADSVRVYQRE